MHRRFLLPAFVVAAVVACSSSAPDATDPTTSVQPAAPSKPAPPPAPTCPFSGKPLDVSMFPTCLDGGRCVPDSLIPADQQKRLSKCPDGFCVPEKILAAEGNYLPKSCTSIAGGEGRCISMVFPDIAAQKDSLPQDVCDANERCAPCWDPTNGMETGACTSVSCDSPKKPKVVFPDCCMMRGKCVPLTMIPKSEASSLASDTCDANAARCVPSEMLKTDWVPPKCKGMGLIGGYDGVCMSDCIPRDFLAQIGTSQGDCTKGFFCAPCKNPLDGTPTGAPGCM